MWVWFISPPANFFMKQATAATSIKRAAADVIALERAALDRWGKGDPSGFLEICAPDVTYFDNNLERRLDGLDALTAYYEKVRGQIYVDRYELIQPKVQFCGEAVVLTFNYVGCAGGKEYRWNCTEVYWRTPKGWRIIQTHWSKTGPAAS
jgi:hypothetical protein